MDDLTLSPIPAGKRCSTCKQVKPRDEFTPDVRNRDGLVSRCSPCERWRHLLRAYGISRDEFERKLTAQGGGCAVCGGDAPAGGWYVDHEHATGKVRGILCPHCNTLVGMLEDAEAPAAAGYLARHAAL